MKRRIRGWEPPQNFTSIDDDSARRVNKPFDESDRPKKFDALRWMLGRC